jgi:hypothetical protein
MFKTQNCNQLLQLFFRLYDETVALPLHHCYRYNNASEVITDTVSINVTDVTQMFMHRWCNGNATVSLEKRKNYCI